MRVKSLIDELSRWAPAIVIAVWIVALMGAWTKGSASLFNALAIVVGALALVLMVTRGMRHMRPKESLGFTRSQSWLAYELAGKGGMPRGSYVLAFAGILTIIVCDFQSPYGKLAFAGFALAVAWLRAHIRYPADRSSG
jgi:hypothetical protein